MSKSLVVILCLACLWGAIFASQSYDIQANPSYAVQHIWSVKIENDEKSANISSQNSNVKIDNISNDLNNKEKEYTAVVAKKEQLEKILADKII